MHTNDDWKTSLERFGAQIGNIEAVLHTQEEIRIRFAPQVILPAACQVSRNLYQYFVASCEIAHFSRPLTGHGNVISIVQGIPSSLFPASIWDAPGHPVVITDRGVEIDGPPSSMPSKRLYPVKSGLGAVFLVGWESEALELRVWGYDSDGLHGALRLIPSLTGVGQPDFVVVRKECAWRGSAGVLAMGFFDSHWRVSEGSYLS